jgi:peptidoglycan-N-acetylglucosamine deacetylase
MFHFYKTPNLIKIWFKNYVWNISTNQKVIYLTFDDGPIPVITEFVIDTLAEFKAKGTFFCVGENIQKHPKIFEETIKAGHSIGNHTFHHLKGWKTMDETYVKDIELCQNQLKIHKYISTKNILRPPYGRIKSTQAKILAVSYKIFMWDVLTYDFDEKLDEKKCLENAIKHTKKGSIVVFHDSLKAEKKLRYVLPKYIQHFSDLGYKFESL